MAELLLLLDGNEGGRGVAGWMDGGAKVLSQLLRFKILLGN